MISPGAVSVVDANASGSDTCAKEQLYGEVIQSQVKNHSLHGKFSTFVLLTSSAAFNIILRTMLKQWITVLQNKKSLPLPNEDSSHTHFCVHCCCHKCYSSYLLKSDFLCACTSQMGILGNHLLHVVFCAGTYMHTCTPNMVRQVVHLNTL